MLVIYLSRLTSVSEDIQRELHHNCPKIVHLLRNLIEEKPSLAEAAIHLGLNAVLNSCFAQYILELENGDMPDDLRNQLSCDLFCIFKKLLKVPHALVDTFSLCEQRCLLNGCCRILSHLTCKFQYLSASL